MASVSVIIPTYNRTEFLREAIESIIGQTEKVEEVLVIDDGSDESFKKDITELSLLSPIIKVITNPTNKGVSYSRNRGVEEATKEYVVFLDDDDTLDQSFVQSAIREFKSNPEVDAIVTKTKVLPTSSDNKRISTIQNMLDERWRFYPNLSVNTVEFFLVHCPMVHSFIFRRKSILPFRFQEDLRYGEDMLLWVQMCADGMNFKWLDITSSYVRVHKSNYTSYMPFKEKEKFYNTLDKSDYLINSASRHFHHMRFLYAMLLGGRMPSLRVFLGAIALPGSLLRFTWLHFSARLHSAFTTF